MLDAGKLLVSRLPEKRSWRLKWKTELHQWPPYTEVPPLTEAVGEDGFHLLRLRVRHGVQVRVEPRHEALAEPFDDAGGLDAVLVILEPLLRREAGHADVVAGLPVAFGIAQVDDVDMVMTAGGSNPWRAC